MIDTPTLHVARCKFYDFGGLTNTDCGRNLPLNKFIAIHISWVDGI